MLSHKSILLSFATLFSLRLLAEPASPDAQAQAVIPAPTALSASVQDGEKIGNEQHRRVFMKVGDRRLMLAVPQGFRPVNTNPETIVFVNDDSSCLLSFRIAAPGSAAAASLKADLCREWLSARFSDLKVQEEFSLNVGGQSGPAFDLHYKAMAVPRSSRVAFIPSPVGVLEFSLVSSPEKFQAAKSEFHGFHRGFRISDADGKLEIPRAQVAS